MFEKIANIFRIPDLRKRVLFTLGLLAVYRLGSHIPTPGINGQMLAEFFNQNSGSALGLVDLFSGGNLRKLTIFALGIIGTGLLAIPVLAGSTAYAIGEGRRWPVGLSRKPEKAIAFYAVLAVSVLLGIGLNFTPLNPIRALYWSAVINGLLAPPVMVLLMLLVRKERVMGKLIVEGWLYWIGWIATAAMALSVVGMGISIATGQ